jgi:anti-sigma B factor antagonist
MEFNYQLKQKDGHVIILLTGNLMEKNQATGLMNEVHQLTENGTRHFIINLKDFKYMNSTGLSVLLNILTNARKAGGDAVICCIPEKVKSLLSITRLTDIFTVTDSEENAVAALAQGA